MKNKNTILVVGIVMLSSLIFFSSCKKKSDTTPTPVTQVVGTASFPAGVSGDLSNAKVSLYTSISEWQSNIPVKFGAVKGSGASVTFALTDILPGTYYLDVWKDIDNSGTWTSNDFVGWYGGGGLGSITLTPFQISSGSTFTASITMYIIAK